MAGAGFKRQAIEKRKTERNFDLRNLRPDTFHDLPEKTGAVFKVAAEFPRPVEGTQKFMSEIAVCHFYIDKLESGFMGKAGGFNEASDDPFHFGIGNHIIFGRMKFFIQKRVRIGGHGLQSGIIVGVAETAGVGQLQTDEKIIGGSEFRSVSGDHFIVKFFKIADIVAGEHHLPGIALTGLSYRAGFASEKQFCSGGGKIHPPPPGKFTGRTIRQTIPTLHRQNAPAVADFKAVTLTFFCQRRFFSGTQNFIIKIEIKFQIIFQMRAERLCCFETRYSGIFCHDLFILLNFFGIHRHCGNPPKHFQTSRQFPVSDGTEPNGAEIRH